MMLEDFGEPGAVIYRWAELKFHRMLVYVVDEGRITRDLSVLSSVH